MNGPRDLSNNGKSKRSSFLKWAIIGFCLINTLILGGAGVGYFLSPLFRREAEQWIDVGRVQDFSPGAPTKVEYVVRRRDAWITNERRASAWIVTADNKSFIAFDPRCTHLGCPYRWSTERNLFLCPCHNGVFNIDGSVISGPAPRPLDRYLTKVVGGRLSILPEAKSNPENS